MGGRTLNIVAGGLAVLLVAGLLWVFFAPQQTDKSGRRLGPKKMQNGSNPTLDVRFQYDVRYLSMGPYIDNAEFPLMLEGEGWILQGKRIRGMASLLHKEPISALYDWLGVMQMDGLERYFDLKEAEAPVYEDWDVAGRLAVHQKLTFEITKKGAQLPGYLSEDLLEGAGKGSRIYVEGWIFFTEKDLFFFQTVSVQPLDDAERAAADEVLQNMQFNAMLGNTDSTPRGDDSGKEQPPR